jgi:hypothetical protein
MIFNRSIPIDIRDHAKDKKLGKTPLIVVSDTSFSFPRLLLVVILVIVGFYTTRLLGKKENTSLSH